MINIARFRQVGRVANVLNAGINGAQNITPIGFDPITPSLCVQCSTNQP